MLAMTISGRTTATTIAAITPVDSPSPDSPASRPHDTITTKVKLDHIQLPSVGFRRWSRFLAVSLQVTCLISAAVGCHYFSPGLQLPSQLLRGLLLISLLGEQRHDGCEQFAWKASSPRAQIVQTFTTRNFYLNGVEFTWLALHYCRGCVTSLLFVYIRRFAQFISQTAFSRKCKCTCVSVNELHLVVPVYITAAGLNCFKCTLI